ncbi:MAG: hypothetical protein ABIR06_03110 [Cyclobacteriaceae bacterium]
MADLFGDDIRTVNEHLQNIYKAVELDREATIRKIRIVQKEGSRDVSRDVDFFNLDAIIAVPSPKAEPFKQWLAKVGYERMSEISNPEESIERARENWQKLGRSVKWIQQRMTGQETRNKLTDYWKESGVERVMNLQCSPTSFIRNGQVLR